MRVLRVFGYIAWLLLLFVLISILLDFPLDFLVALTFGGFSENAERFYSLSKFGLSLLLTVLVAIFIRRRGASGSRGNDGTSSPGVADVEEGQVMASPSQVPASSGLADAAPIAGQVVGDQSVAADASIAPAVAAAETPKVASPRAFREQPVHASRLRLPALPVLLVLAVLLVALGAIGAYAISSLGREDVGYNPAAERIKQEYAESSSQQEAAAPSASLTPTTTPYVPPVPGDAELLESYFSDVEDETAIQGMWVTWEWSGGGTHRGTLFGPRVAVEYRSDGSKWWLNDRKDVRELASNFETLSMDLAAVEPPDAMRSAHNKLVRAVRIEARRWRRFDDVVRKSDDAQWTALATWEKWSKPAFMTQKRYLDDWAFAVRTEARKHNVKLSTAVPLPLPHMLPFKRYVQRVEQIVR